MAERFDQNQPRVPSGSPEGGQFGEVGGGPRLTPAEAEAEARKSIMRGSTAAHEGGVVPLQGSAGHPLLISNRAVSAVKATLDSERQYLPIDLSAMKEIPKNFAKDMQLFKDRNFYPALTPKEVSGSSDEIARSIISRCKDNLRLLYDSVPQDIRERSKLWYVGTRRMVERRMQQYGLHDASVAAVYASLSPQKPWYENVYLGDRLMEIYSTKQSHEWDSKMEETANRIWKKTKGKDNAALIADVRGKRLDQLTRPDDKAMWIRTYDEAHSSRMYHSITPEGEYAGHIVNADGKPARAAWQATGAIADAVMAIESQGDRTIISYSMGEKHKVRNFYNNILDPFSPNGDVTVDTHAVGAAWLQPHSSKSVSVIHSLKSTPQAKHKPAGFVGATGSAITGVQGTYGIYAQAYRELAAELKIQPRELQSITWEAQRGLFGENWKSKERADHISDIWRQFGDGKISLREAQVSIVSFAGGFKPPEWVNKSFFDVWGERGYNIGHAYDYLLCLLARVMKKQNGEPRSPYHPGIDAVLDRMRRNDLPITRENYIEQNYGTRKLDWNAEDELDLPEELQDWSLFEVVGGDLEYLPEKAKAKQFLARSVPRSLYVHRDLQNVAEIAAWARSQNLTDILEDPHVTVLYSKTPVDWSAMGTGADSVTVPASDDREVIPLGDGGAIVLKFKSDELAARHQYMLDHGASSDYEGYTAHMTITWSGELPQGVEPFRGALIFGPEIFQPIDETDSSKPWAKDFDPNQPRDEDGKWTGGGSSSSTSFISPNTGTLSFAEAVTALNSDRQHKVMAASAHIDAALGIKSTNYLAIGAWADGAENSMMVVSPGASVAQNRVASAMKGHIADQKAVLVFNPSKQGNNVLANFDVAGKPGDLHDKLLKAGLSFHTLQPLGADRYRVHVFSSDQKTIDAVDKASKEFGAIPEFVRGNGEFIGTTKEDGTDREQRDDAKRQYEQVIHSVANSGDVEGQNVGTVWNEVRNHWGAGSTEGTANSAGSDGPGRARSADEAQGIAEKAARGYAPLTGLPQKPIKVGDGWYVPGPIGTAKAAAETYMKQAGLPYTPPVAYLKVDKERAGRIANAFEAMKHDPNDPATKASYAALAKEVSAQWQVVKATGLKIEFIKEGQPDPYATSLRMAAMDVIHNNHLWVFPTTLGFGSGTEGAADAKNDNPMLQDTGEIVDGHKMLVNDQFRIVHDYFGHFKEGVGFRSDGEENAWRSHAAMFTPLARAALTSETRGQNSWLNFGPPAEHNKTASPADTIYAPQKIGIMANWASDEGRLDSGKAPKKDFDPNQPRDEDGKWTGGGSDSGSGSIDSGGKGASASQLAHKFNTQVDIPKLVASVPGAEAAIAKARALLADSVPTDAPVDKGGHRLPNGDWTPERTKLHEQILSKVFTKDAIERARSDNPTVTLLGGRGGSGKSWFTKKLVDTKTSILIDADAFKSALPEYAGWNAASVHEESSHLVQMSENLARANKLNIIHDATMKNGEQLAKRLDRYKADGYAVRGLYMFTSNENAAKRALGRFVGGTKGDKMGRFVPPEIPAGSITNEKSFDELTPRMNSWAVYDNNTPGGSPQLFASKGEKK